MKPIRTIRLTRHRNDSAVHCEIELCAHAAAPDRYLVNLRQGRIGDEWRESTRTPQPVDLAVAERLFAAAVEERLAQGFVAAGVLPSLAGVASAPAMEAPATAPASPAARDEADALVLRLLQPNSWKTLGQARRKRAIWRVGERRLRSAVPVLVGLLERGDAMQDYCIAWAIGRCGDPGAAEAMRELHARGASDAVRRVALHAWLLLADAGQRREYAQALVAAWPDALRTAWDDGDHVALAHMVASGTGWRGLAVDAWLEQLDQLALCRPAARAALLAMLRAAPLRPGTFRAVRHIYKMAEMHGDAEVFALLQRRFETTVSMSDDYLFADGRYRSYREAAARPDSTVAYGTRTRAYLLRRGWRTLRRLGTDADPDFIPMARAMLALYDDGEAASVRHETRRGRQVVDQYGHWPLFNHLLRAHAGLRHSASGLSWYRDGAAPPPDQRQEAFPALWDRHPEALLWLMKHSRCDGVHVFAARALSDNGAFCDALALETLRALLGSPYLPSARFAFAQARRRFEPGVPDAAWLMLFVQATLPEAVQYALDCIGRAPDAYAADAPLVAALLCAPVEAVRRQGWILCQAALKLPGQPDAIVARLLDWLDACGSVARAETLVPAIVADLFWALDHPLRAAAAQVPHARLLQLLTHRLAAVRALACQWLLLHAAPATDLPAPALAALLRDPDALVRAMGARLFGALPDHLLALQSDLVAVLACAPDATVRHAIAPVVARLGAGEPVFAAALLGALLDGLFRAETGAGMHADLLAWIAGPLAAAPALADPDLLRRLLDARSKGAQLLGAALIGRFDAAGFEVADWAAFGRNQNASVRRWAYAAFAADPARVRTHLEAALRLFDSQFDDTREFAIRFFGDACTRTDWTARLLLDLCDHPEPSAQRFGRAMITTHFEVAEIAVLMLDLSQHPSPAMQLFVSAWLESASGGDLTRLRRLEPYFLRVLSQVNRGRVARQRVQAFLRAQAMLSQDIGAFVARLFARQVVTVAIADKACYIEGLRAIQQRYPDLPPVMTIRPPAVPVSARKAP